MSIKTIAAIAVFAAALSPAQLASPNSLGAAIGHIHLNVKDVDAQTRFWTQVGAKPINNEKLVMMQFPGIYIILRKQDSTGGTVGSVVNHFGLHVKNIDESLAKWRAAGLTIEPPGNNPKQAYLIGPDDVRVEIIENAAMSTPVAMHHIHLWVPDPVAAQAWYVKNFAAVAGKRNQFETATVPGAEITFAKSDTTLAPTKGRSVDHIGFEVKNLDETVKRLADAGIQTEAPIRNSANASNLRIAYIFDPFGTYIELTEGLAPKTTSSASR